MDAGALFLDLNLCPGKEQSKSRMVSSDFGKITICNKSSPDARIFLAYIALRKEAESLGMWKYGKRFLFCFVFFHCSFMAAL